MNRKELESINVTRMWNKESYKHKETLSKYGNYGKENTLITSENKENTRDSYDHMYECSKHFFHSTYECVYTEEYTTISKMKNIVVE